MTTLSTQSLEFDEDESKCDKPSSPVRSTLSDSMQSNSNLGDLSSHPYKTTPASFSYLLDHDEQIYTILMQTSVLYRCQSCCNVHCQLTNPVVSKKETLKLRQMYVDHIKQSEASPRGLNFASSVMGSVAFMRNKWHKPERPTGIPKVIYIQKDADWTTSTPSKSEETVLNNASPTSVWSERLTFPRPTSSHQSQLSTSISTLTPTSKRQRFRRQSSSTRKLTYLVEL